jgi:hypothetical protein
MRSRSLIDPDLNAAQPPSTGGEVDTYQRVRRTLDDALAELELELDLETLLIDARARVWSPL